MKNQILKLLSTIVIILIALNVDAQLIVADPKLEAGQAKQNLLQKIMEKIQHENLLNTIDIKKSSETLTRYTKDFHEALKTVSNQIANSSEVSSIMELQKQYVKMHFTKVIEIGNKLKTSNERQAFRIIMNAGLKSSFNMVSKLKMIVTPEYYKMNDNERLTKIELIKTNLSEHSRNMLAYCKSIEELNIMRELNQPKPLGDYKKN